MMPIDLRVMGREADLHRTHLLDQLPIATPRGDLVTREVRLPRVQHRLDMAVGREELGHAHARATQSIHTQAQRAQVAVAVRIHQHSQPRRRLAGAAATWIPPARSPSLGRRRSRRGRSCRRGILGRYPRTVRTP